MKIKYFTYIICFLLFSINSFSQENHNTNKGYKIDGDYIIFIFNVNDYPNIKHNGEPINDVFVSGEFNDWALDQWKMNKVNDSIYQLPKKRSFFAADIDWEFKFIINGKHWAEPSDNFENIVDALDYKGNRLMTYNLKLYNAFITESGNVTFELKGYKDAKNVILSGSFNRWDETNFKMKPTDYGWELTLQLRPGIYEYKFIVKYSHLKIINYSKWIEDPENPWKKINEFGGYNSLIDVRKNVRFNLCDFKDAKTVILSGSFNDWNEEQFKMHKVNDCWVYEQDLSGGKYHYKFIVDGEWIIDPNNTVKEYDDEGNINSVCMVK